MTALLAVVLSIAAVDSLNPSTVGPALVLAALTEASARRVAAFTVGVFTVSTAGGIVLLVGPGRGLLARLAKPSAHAEHLAATVGGTLLLAVAIVLWARRARPRERRERGTASTRAGLALGAGIMAIELPTALPYFAAIVAIVESRRSTITGIVLVLLYNVVFVAPLLVVLALSLLVDNARMLAVRFWLERQAPTLVPLVVGTAGAVLLAFGMRAF